MKSSVSLSEARRMALSLPEALEQPHHELTSFRVRAKIFATIARDEQHMHIFVDELAREQAIAISPHAIDKLWWGEKVLGIRVCLSKVDAKTLMHLLQLAWARKAPKSLQKSE
jgi:hypothetical protein